MRKGEFSYYFCFDSSQKSHVWDKNGIPNWHRSKMTNFEANLRQTKDMIFRQRVCRLVPIRRLAKLKFFSLVSVRMQCKESQINLPSVSFSFSLYSCRCKKKADSARGTKKKRKKETERSPKYRRRSLTILTCRWHLLRTWTT